MSSSLTANSTIAPLLRWAGSKRKLIPELLKQTPSSFERYVEPFCGSACLFFALRPENAIISDLNPELIQTYVVLRDHPKLVFQAVSAMPRTKRFYYQLRRKKPGTLCDIDRAARFIYLNRNCFNGVFRTNRSGDFNVPRGSRAGETPTQSHFLRCANALRRATLLCGDFAKTLNEITPGDFVYLDPPYAKEGARRRGEYGYASFDTPDLSRLKEYLDEIDKKGAVFLLSYAYCGEILRISSDSWSTRSLLVRRHVAGFDDRRAVVKELLISNRQLTR